MMKMFKKQKGFTVLESIIAIFILSLSISGIFTAIQQSFFQATTARDEVKAFYLAQEAVEIIRNKRDTNQLDRINGGVSTWLSGITDAANCPLNKFCRADAKDMSLTYCGDASGSCPNLKQDTATYLYGYASGDLTNFNREIQIEPIPGTSDEVSITVKISWTEGFTTQDFKVKTLLLNWI